MTSLQSQLRNTLSSLRGSGSVCRTQRRGRVPARVSDNGQRSANPAAAQGLFFVTPRVRASLALDDGDTPAIVVGVSRAVHEALDHAVVPSTNQAWFPPPCVPPLLQN